MVSPTTAVLSCGSIANPCCGMACVEGTKSSRSMERGENETERIRGIFEEDDDDDDDEVIMMLFPLIMILLMMFLANNDRSPEMKREEMNLM